MMDLSDYAMVEGHPKYKQAIKREHAIYTRAYDIRTPFVRDYTRLIFSQGYRRLKNKTQVFFAVDDDHVCTRLEHVNLVSSIANTIARELKLNTELTQAIATGHDIGHAPFGHGGERILKDISQHYHLEPFWHERNSLHFVDDIEVLEDDYHHFYNLDLTYAVRDGIIAHCGEMQQALITPRDEVIDLQKDFTCPGMFEPYTYEGCVVKMSDKIAYLARDIEDALRLHIIDHNEVNALRDELNALGGYQFNAINNGSVVNYFIQDVIHHSSSAGIGLSEEAYRKMHIIMNFNYKHIYLIKRVDIHNNYVKLMMNSLFEFLYDYYQSPTFLEDLKDDRDQYHTLITHYLAHLEKHAQFPHIPRNPNYENKVLYDFEHDPQAITKSILDYLAGMTDTFLIKSFNELLSF